MCGELLVQPVHVYLAAKIVKLRIVEASGYGHHLKQGVEPVAIPRLLAADQVTLRQVLAVRLADVVAGWREGNPLLFEHLPEDDEFLARGQLAHLTHPRVRMDVVPEGSFPWQEDAGAATGAGVLTDLERVLVVVERVVKDKVDERQEGYEVELVAERGLATGQALHYEVHLCGEVLDDVDLHLEVG